MPEQAASVADSFTASVRQSWWLEQLPVWVRALSTVRLLLAAHRRGVSTAPIWPSVEHDAAALRECERNGFILGTGSNRHKDPQRERVFLALLCVAISTFYMEARTSGPIPTPRT